MGVSVDITEKKLAELQQERIKIKQLLSNTLGARISNIENQDELLQTFSNLLIETKFIKDCCLIVNQNEQNSESTFTIKRVYPNKKASVSLEKRCSKLCRRILLEIRKSNRQLSNQFRLGKLL